MPTIRDGRGVLTEYDMAVPTGSPSGPVERVVEPSVVRRQTERKHDYMAASRARGAAAGGFVAGAPKAEPVGHRYGPKPGIKRSPETVERMRQAQLARYARERDLIATAPAIAEAGGGPGSVETPPEPVHNAVNIPAPAASPEPIPGEDRCAFGRWVGNPVLLVCDLAAEHIGGHRGRLMRLGVTNETVSFLGHAAVAS